VETLTYSSGRASGCDSPGLLNPKAEGFALEDRVVVVLAGFTVCDTAPETLLKKFALPA
jgi:hypothetical protein